MKEDTYRGNWNPYLVDRGRWQAFARWAIPGEPDSGGVYPHFAASPAMSRRRCKRWVRLLAKKIKKGEVNQ